MAYRRTPEVEERLADKRQRIVKAVRRVVGEVGFREAQIGMVAAAAGVATGTVYRYFPSKAELFAEAVSLNSAHEVDVVAAVVDSDGTPIARLEAALRVFASRALRARRLAYAMIAEPAEAEVEAARLKYRRAFARLFQQLIDQGIAAKEIPSQDAEATSACIVGALIEGLIGPLAPDAVHEAEAQPLIETIVAFCLRAVGAGPSKERAGNVARLRPVSGGKP